MPTLEENRYFWDKVYDWQLAGEEWSADWGGSFMQWYGGILPRLAAHLPAATILEIGCGCGRWTQYLKDHCVRLIAIDLAERCIRICQERLAAYTHIEYHVNDGKSLEMVADHSVDLVFSFDSLVHADALVLKSYLAEFSRILKRNGVVFLHHSNLGEYAKWCKFPKLAKLLAWLGLWVKDLHGRDFSVDAKKVEAWARKFGLACVSQEILSAGIMLDCLSVIVRQDSALVRPNRVLRNTRFSQEKANLKTLAWLYSPRT